MEILKPIEPTAVSETKTAPSEPSIELMSNSLTPETISTLKYLGLTNSLFDDVVMDKVKEISEYLGEDLEYVDISTGNPNNLSKLDKLYSYVRLKKQADNIREREFLIHEQLMKYNN